jgi:ACDE family multidrug resistance protein
MTPITSLFGQDGDVIRDVNFQLLVLANLMGPLGTALVSPLLDSLTGPFGVSGTRIGLILSVFSAPAIVVIPLVGIIADRYGRKPIIVTGLLLFGTGGLGIAFTTDFNVVLALRLLQGIGFAGLLPLIVTSIGDLYDGSREATAQGLRFASSGLSQAFFPLVAGVLVVTAWQYPFFLFGLAIPIGIVVSFLLDEPTDAVTDTDGTGDYRPDADEADSLRSLLAHPSVAAILVGRSIPPFVYIGFLTFNSFLVVKVLDGSPQVAGILVALVSLVYALAGSQAGRITTRFRSRAGPLVAANLSLGVGMTVIALAPHVLMTVFGTVLLGVGIGINLSLYRSIITGVAPPVLRGSLVSVGASLSRVATTISPIIVGSLIGFFEPSMGFAAAVRTVVLVVGVAGGATGLVCVAIADSAQLRSSVAE